MFKNLITLIVELLSLCSIILTIQINLYLTDRFGDDVLQHHCLHLPMLMEKDILTYCLSENPSKWKIEENHVDRKFTFAQLDEENITSEQLYRWSAPIDIAERYQLYLHQRSIPSDVFYNCSSPRFGPLCEYSLDIPQQFDQISLQDILNDYYQKQYEPTTLTCYEHLICHRGSTYACLDWSEICDGYIDCLNDAVDEENCWLLDINECTDDEYRCSNGQCIAKVFFRDDPYSFECLDRSDGILGLSPSLNSIQEIPSFTTEDIVCPLRAFLLHVKTTSSCVRKRDAILKEMMFIDTPNNLSEICWLAFNCFSIFHHNIDPRCEQICANKSCKEIVNEQCSEMIIMPAKPLAFGHMHVAYMKKIVMDLNTVFRPDYVCYNDKLCGGFLPNKTLLTFNNLTCRRPKDFPIGSISLGRFSLFDMILRALYMETSHCNTIIHQNFVHCNSSMMYQCINSLKCISKYRLCDGQIDCDYKDDEHCPLINGTCPTHNISNLLFPCPKSNKCISLKLIDSGDCDCGIDQYGLCDDEQTTLRTIRKHISFPTICDGFLELMPINIDGRNETDETECQYWQCNNTYTRCNGIWNCLDGADEVDCDPSSFIECPIHHHHCISLDTYQLMCLPIEKSNDGIIDCLGATDEPRLCRSNTYQLSSDNFYCRNDPYRSCTSTQSLCYYGGDCAHGDGRIVCIQNENSSSFDNVCDNKYAQIRTKAQSFLCQRIQDIEKKPIIHFSLNERRQLVNPSSSRSSMVSLPHLYEYRCHRGIPIRVWLNLATNVSDIACFCPPSFYGSQCQYQNQRVSLTIQFQTFSHSRRTLFALVISLIDDSHQRIIHSYEQMTFLYTQHCQRKFNIYLLYSTRPKLPRRNYSIHIDIYEKISLTYSGSLLIPINMSFLPVHRIAVLRYIPRMIDSTPVCSDQECIHGQCMKYFNDPNETSFCHCEQGWTGKYCTIPHTCHCSSDSFCAGISANNRSICICPVNKWGIRCLLHNPICQVEPNTTCLNGGRCNALDENAPMNEQFICICPKGFSGKRCEQMDHALVISFDENIILPQSVLLHFIREVNNALPENGSTYKTVPVDRQSMTIQWSRPFHIAFVELFDQIYYLITVQKTNHTPKNLTKTIHSSDRCPHIREVLNDTIANYHLLRRIKYYHLPCQQRTSNLSCFFDANHFCLCEQFGQGRISNCFEFNSTMKHDCFGQSNCENGGRCFQDRSICAQTSTCLCPKCFFGSRCQFSSNLFGLSLDAILASHIQPHIPIADQPSIVKVSIALIIILNIVGLINGLLSWITFRNHAPQKVGCGLYLLIISIVTLLLVIILTMKFSILLVAQMTYMSNASFLRFQCITLDFLLNVCLIVYDWLSACVAIERAFAIAKGAKFHMVTSRKVAKYVIPCLIFLLSITMIHDPISRRLLYDDHDDEEEKRIWCIVTYSSSFQVLSNVINMIHFLAPFAFNIISAIVIIVFTARQRSYLHRETTYRNHLRQQFSQHRHLLVAPILLTILALPRLIISFLANCTDTNNHAWLFLFGYFISFCPSMLTFFVFVLPSKFYKNEFWDSIKSYTRITRLRLYFLS